MSEVSKFIPMEENGVDVTSNAAVGAENSAFKVLRNKQKFTSKTKFILVKIKRNFNI